MGVATPTIQDRDRDETAATRAASRIREMVMSQKLLPGEQVRQSDMAAAVGISRIPIREALNILHTEGLLDYESHKGYFVAKRSAEDLRQLALMRSLLEDQLVKSLEWPDKAYLADLRALNRQMLDAANEGRIDSLVVLNRSLHFGIFALSPLRRVREEVARLWQQSDVYRALYLHDLEARLRIVREHTVILDLLAKRDAAGLTKALDSHRSGAVDDVVRILVAFQ